MHSSRLWLSESSSGWVFAQQILVRALVSLKFFWIASLVGPEVVGYVSLGLLVLAIAEALLDTGLLQAAIQSDRVISKSDAGAWLSLQGVRGGAIFLVLWSGAEYFAGILSMAAASAYIQAAAVVPLVKSMASPGLALAHRERKFRSLFFIELAVAFADLFFCVTAIQIGFGGVYIIFGFLVGEFVRFLCSWAIFPLWAQPNFRWKSIGWLTSYGKWVWQTSVLVVVLNQVDKIIVSRVLGAHDLGVYQTALKISQLLIVDVPGAYAQYLFPSFSLMFREHRDRLLKSFNVALLHVLLLALFGMAIMLSGVVEYFIELLGKAWSGAVPLMPWLAFPMLVGAVICVLVAFARAIGAPDAVARATRYQLGTLCLAATVGINYSGVHGLIVGVAVSGLVAAIYIYRECRKIVYANFL